MGYCSNCCDFFSSFLKLVLHVKLSQISEIGTRKISGTRKTVNFKLESLLRLPSYKQQNRIRVKPYKL